MTFCGQARARLRHRFFHAKFLKDWLIQHIFEEDKRYSAFLTIMVAGTTPEDERDLWVEGVG